MTNYTAEISLEGLEFFAYHGFYEEERQKGNNFTVDVKVSIPYTGVNTEDLHNTVNYEGLYKITAEEMAKPSLLLETIAHNIIEQLFSKYPQITSAEVSVVKHNPPIEGNCKRSRVTLRSVR